MANSRKKRNFGYLKKDSLKHINPHSLHDVETPRSVLLLVLQAMESMSKELQDAFALAHYFQRQDVPTLCALMSDDAP